MNKRIDILKGIAIVLVVLGHIHPDDTPNLAWNSLRSFLYSFHLPLFFILSGYFMAIKMPSFKTVFTRNAVPFFSFTVITLCYKLLLQMAGHSDEIQHQVTWQTLGAHFLVPAGQFAAFLWFLYTLFILQAGYLLVLNRYPKWIVFGVFLALAHWKGWTGLFCVSKVMENYPFFMAGAMLADYKEKAVKWSVPAILIGLCLYPFAYQTSSWFYMSEFLATVVPWAVLWWVVWKIDENRMGWLAALGRCSLDIYLWHTLMNGVLYFVLSHFNHNFWVLTALTWFSSVGICFLIAYYLKQSPFLRVVLYGRFEAKPKAAQTG